MLFMSGLWRLDFWVGRVDERRLGGWVWEGFGGVMMGFMGILFSFIFK